jgi:hypothetical protein
MPDKKEKLLDELLDSALNEYSRAEPRSGLENRILATLSSKAQQESRWSWSRWQLWTAAAAVACVVVAVLAINHKQHSAPLVAPGQTIAKSTGSNSVPTVSKTASAPHVRKITRRKQQRLVAGTPAPVIAAVKQSVFPSPSPLSDQERLLFAYLKRTPYQELVQNSKPDEPKLEIEMNQVAPFAETRNTNSR